MRMVCSAIGMMVPDAYDAGEWQLSVLALKDGGGYVQFEEAGAGVAGGDSRQQRKHPRPGAVRTNQLRRHQTGVIRDRHQSWNPDETPTFHGDVPDDPFFNNYGSYSFTAGF